MRTSPIRESQIPTMLKLLKPKEDDLILDAGCGNAAISGILSESSHVVAVDIRFQKKYKRFVVCDLQYLPFKDHVFDKILCSSTIQHVEDDNLAIKELSRSLKKGGIIVFNIPSKRIFFFLPAILKLFSVFRGTGYDEVKDRIFEGFSIDIHHLYDPKEFKEILSENRFEISRMIWTPTVFFQYFYEFDLAIKHVFGLEIPKKLMYILAGVDKRLPKFFRSSEFVVCAKKI